MICSLSEMPPCKESPLPQSPKVIDIPRKLADALKNLFLLCLQQLPDCTVVYGGAAWNSVVFLL